MALAKKCDRCGTYYDYYGPDTLSGCEFNAVAEIFVDKKEEIVNDSRKLDLCQKCRKSFKEWLNGGQ